jgi:hypothetical protein
MTETPQPDQSGSCWLCDYAPRRPRDPRRDTHRRREQYEDKYRLCYLRGPEGIMLALAQKLG